MSLQLTSTDERKSRKPRAPSRKQRQLVDFLAKGGTQKLAAETIGFSEEHVSRLMKKTQFRRLLHERASENLARGQVRASARVIELLDCESSHACLNAAELVLKANGLLPSDAPSTSLHLNLAIAPGYVVDLSGSVAPAIEHDAPDSHGSGHG